MEFRAVKCTIYHKVILLNTVSTPDNQKGVREGANVLGQDSTTYNKSGNGLISIPLYASQKTKLKSNNTLERKRIFNANKF